MSATSLPLADLAIVRRDGTIISEHAGFLDDVGCLDLSDLVAAARSNPSRTFYEAIELRGEGFAVLAIAGTTGARDWKIDLPADSRASGEGAVVVCRISRTSTHARIRDFCAAFGLGDAITRLVVALYDTGDVKLAADRAGITFHTAREYLKKARSAIWAPNLQQLVTWAAIGALPVDPERETDDIFAFLFSLTQRQRRIAAMIADGASRSEAARHLAISEASVKKELSAIYAATGVRSATGLARLSAELRCLAIATGEAPKAEPFPPPFSREIMIAAAGGRRIAMDDYGPIQAEPVLVFHNTLNCRGCDRALVDALQNAGYRPISPDRPGYGDTSPAPRDCSGAAFLDLCADDVKAICDHLGRERIKVIAHGPVHVVLAVMRRYPALLERAVIDAPEPDSASETRAQGMMAGLKRQFARRPKAVEAMARILFTLASLDRVAAFMDTWTASSPADRRVMRDPALLMDFYRKLLPFRRGQLDGLVREQVLQATMGRPARVTGASHLALMIGATDFMHDAAANAAYWRGVLPDAQLTVIADAGRFVSYSHPERVVAALGGR
ncbi:MAG: alpha/beta fold hydrolase [Porphyrobacter sp.]|nr:alpha/beta fold hydrolase [Porphyrobacter sp.]